MTTGDSPKFGQLVYGSTTTTADTHKEPGPEQLRLFDFDEPDDSMTLEQFIRRADIPRTQYSEFHRLRKQAFVVAAKVFDDRAQSYNVDHQPFQEHVYGPVGIAGEIFKRARRMAALLSPLRKEALRRSDVNRIVDVSVDLINYLSWMYALAVLASRSLGHEDSDDAPDYLDGREGVAGQ